MSARRVKTRGSGRPGASASTSARRPASARRAPCSTRGGAASSAAPTSWSASSRRTSGPTRWSRSATCPSCRASRCEYRDSDWEEMDVDAVIARKPEVVLIDELAHTNVPGSGRHEKRWEDVLEILDAGIAVITTVNIQHIESLADAVERITGVGVRERVPDWVVRRGRPARADRLLGRPAAPPHAARQHLPGAEGARPRSTGSSGPRTSSRCASSRCASWPTRPRRSSSSTSARRARPASCGRRPSGSWWP